MIGVSIVAYKQCSNYAYRGLLKKLRYLYYNSTKHWPTVDSKSR